VTRLQQCALLTLASFCCIGCGDGRLEPAKRPANVPETAVWAGGADGGAYVLCTVDAVLDANRCTVWDVQHLRKNTETRPQRQVLERWIYPTLHRLLSGPSLGT
jgi:hypothetical protein